MDSDRMRITIPRRPILDFESPIVTIGSCFAEHVEVFLQLVGMNVHAATWGRHYNLVSIYDTLDTIINERPLTDDEIHRDEDGFAITRYPMRGRFDSEDSARAYVSRIEEWMREGLARSRILVVTMGMTETWKDCTTGQTVNNHNRLQGLDVEPYNLSYLENLTQLIKIRELLKAIDPDYQLIVSVSPIPLWNTFRDQHFLISNSASKAVLRAAADDFCESYDDAHYFPSYDIIVEELNALSYVREDREIADGHPRAETLGTIMERFCEGFLTESAESRLGTIRTLFRDYQIILERTLNPDLEVTEAHLELCDTLQARLAEFVEPHDNHPDYYRTLIAYNRACLLRNKGDLDAALDHFRDIVDRILYLPAEFHHPLQRFLAGSHYYMAEIFFELEDTGLGILHLDLCLSVTPNHAAAHERQAELSTSN